MIDKRPKDMTRAERAALPVRSYLENKIGDDGRPIPLKLPREGLRGDDLIGYWRDNDGQWYREPPLLF